MAQVTVIYGSEIKSVQADEGEILGDVVARTGLPLEQPCAGRGTCGKCKVLVEEGTAPPDEIELQNLTAGEIALNNRLACRARVQGKTRIVLSPILVYSNKIFRGSSRYKKDKDIPLGLAVDLGSTTVAAFLTCLDNGEVAAGGGGLNQQTVYGSDVISRMAIVGNVAMHHLLAELPLDQLATIPFQPYEPDAIKDASPLMDGIFPEHVKVSLPPLIGGFVGSDALACLAYFGFDKPQGPMLAIDLGTNGEVMVTDGDRILTASTAAGPAFEGVNISCGSRAVDGAITDLDLNNGDFTLTTIADAEPVGLTGSGLLATIAAFRKIGIIEESGRINPDCAAYAEQVRNGNGDHSIETLPDGRIPKPCLEYLEKISKDDKGSRRVLLAPDKDLYLTQLDIRELQKAKGAIRAAVDVLLANLDLQPQDLTRVILTGSFGGQVDIQSILDIGMIPPVDPEIVETAANGAGFGAAIFLSEEGFELGEKLAQKAEQIDLDTDAQFNQFYIDGMRLAP